MPPHDYRTPFGAELVAVRIGGRRPASFTSPARRRPHQSRAAAIPSELVETIDLRLLLGVAHGDDCPTLAASLGLGEPAVRKRLRRMAGAEESAWLRQAGRQHHLTERGRAMVGPASQAVAASQEIVRLLGVESLSMRHVRVVTTIAATGSIGTAAGQLQIPQPSLSAQLARIERRWQATLFERTRSGVEPAPRLVELLPHLRLLDRALSCLAAPAAAEEPSVPPGDLQLASEFGFHGLIDALRDDAQVDVRQHIIEIPGPDWTPTMLAADICLYADLPFVSLAVPPGREKAVAFEDPAHVLMPLGADGGRTAVSLRELADYDWISGPPGSRNHQSVLLLCRSMGFDPRIRFTALNGPSGRRIIEDGSAVALTGATLVPSGAVRAVRLAEDVRVRMTVGWRRRSTATATAQWIVRWLREGQIRRLAELRPELLAEMRADPVGWPAFAEARSDCQ
ncbi:LysR family transcriptional regulator [Micromonospora sp. C31]|uniref:LysR family transcriptional regulator n=1 Tax=Micromonospora sp. C31 TaxID=2824876 RepID=UPI001B386460|nr:LysR substrate-binding domain-containing protein [Micromonospora sp. C31]MBQ1072360.1 LysR family transcriptional regulator [Micromonospora sp. C31]